jgi:hypothetical protein
MYGGRQHMDTAERVARGDMNGDEKKAASTAYKERKIVGGIYLVRCTASGEVWVGQWPNLETIRNRIWFTLRSGTNPCEELQQRWRQHRPENFQFEVLERLSEDDPVYVRNALLKERASYWRSRLNAAAI